jgi:Uma2 family endonuclease
VDKVELIDGEVIVTPAPNFMHQLVLGRLVNALRNWARAQSRDVVIGQAPVDIRFGPDRILQPDAFVIFDNFDGREPSPLRRIPEICVEILSTNRVHDRVTKKLLYAQCGVQEYWVVDVAASIEQWTGPGLSAVRDLDGVLTSSRLPGFSITFSELFRPEAAERG